MSHKYINKFIPLRSISVTLADIEKMFERLKVYLNDEADRQIKATSLPQGKTESEFADEMNLARTRAFRITVTIKGADGTDLFGDTVEIFNSSNIPESISSIYMTNVTAYQGHTGRRPPNNFALFLDFSKPALVDNNNPISNPTENGSNIIIEGELDSWVVFSARTSTPGA